MPCCPQGSGTPALSFHGEESLGPGVLLAGAGGAGRSGLAGLFSQLLIPQERRFFSQEGLLPGPLGPENLPIFCQTAQSGPMRQPVCDQNFEECSASSGRIREISFTAHLKWSQDCGLFCNCRSERASLSAGDCSDKRFFLHGFAVHTALGFVILLPLPGFHY